VFTGIIEEVGQIEAIQQRIAGARVRIRCQQVLSDTQEGASIAVNGCCLTALDLHPDSFASDLSPETLSRTNLGGLQSGSLVNLERPLLATGRLNGHVVQGHVDGTGEFLSYEALGDGNWWLKVRIPKDLGKYVVSKGSIAIDGISLTVAGLDEEIVSVAIIPQTYHATALRDHAPGNRVNIEVDVFAKYVEKLLSR
jgi:riboflavin synthase